MDAGKAVTLRLGAEEYRRLEAEARRLGTRPSALARQFVRDGLTGDPGAEQRRVGLEALDRLAELRAMLREAGYPEVDAAQLIREGREELDRRPTL